MKWDFLNELARTGTYWHVPARTGTYRHVPARTGKHWHVLERKFEIEENEGKEKRRRKKEQVA